MSNDILKDSSQAGTSTCFVLLSAYYWSRAPTCVQRLAKRERKCAKCTAATLETCSLYYIYVSYIIYIIYMIYFNIISFYVILYYIIIFYYIILYYILLYYIILSFIILYSIYSAFLIYFVPYIFVYNIYINNDSVVSPWNAFRKWLLHESPPAYKELLPAIVFPDLAVPEFMWVRGVSPFCVACLVAFSDQTLPHYFSIRNHHHQQQSFGCLEAT